MRLLMACSVDGYLCGKVDDDMSWTGAEDKRIFRALTGVGGTCAAGSVTHDIMPELDGRRLIRISREKGVDNWSLEKFQREYPNGWLLGGPSIAHAAMRRKLVREFHLCVISHVWLKQGVHMDWMTVGTPYEGTYSASKFKVPDMHTRFDGVDLMVWRKR